MTEGASTLIVGVGGQGVLLASEVLASVGLGHGCEVKKSDVHGMSQRGGIVYSHVRCGAKVSSPLIEKGGVDALVALEWAEGLRWASYLSPRGVAIVDAAQIVPPVACSDRRSWRSSYPALDPRALESEGRDVYLVDGRGLAESAGTAGAANMVLLGTLSCRLEFAPDNWEAAIRRLVPPRTVEANLRAFELGRGVPALSGALPTPEASGGPRDRRLFEIEVLEAWCKGCDICVRFCPEDCLRLDTTGIVRVVAPEMCTGCQLCERLCPDFAIAVRERGRTSCG